MQVKGRDSTSLSWSLYPKITKRVDPSVLSSLDHEVIQIFRYFRSLDSNTFINLDHEDDDGVMEYLGMKEDFLT